MRNIILTGRVADDELSDLLSAAEALTLSHYLKDSDFLL